MGDEVEQPTFDELNPRIPHPKIAKGVISGWATRQCLNHLTLDSPQALFGAAVIVKEGEGGVVFLRCAAMITLPLQ